jgi:cell division protein FtsW (lipid II flippase)
MKMSDARTEMSSEVKDYSNSARSEHVLQRITAIRAPRLLRLLELTLILFALAIGVGAIFIIDMALRGSLQHTLLAPGIVYAAAIFILHIVVRIAAPDSDPLIIPLATLLNNLGIAMIYRIDLGSGAVTFASTSVRQLVWSIVAIAAAILIVIFLRNHLVLFRYTYIFGLAGIVLLILPLTPGLGMEVGGSRQWIKLFGLTFQPVELAKIALTVFFAGYLVRNRDALSMVGKKFGPIRFPRGRDLGPLLVIWAIAMGMLVFQHELGTAVLIFGLFLALLYLATGRIGWVLLGGGLFIGGGLLAANTLTYVGHRFQNWLDPWLDAQGESFQLVQGMFGMANGGMLGTGLGQGFPGDTPLSRSDYILPSLGEELGLVGLFVILIAYLLFSARGLRIGFAGQDDFGKLLAVGLAFAFALQVFVVAGGVTRVIPLTGLTAPFLAAGGSSLVSNWIIVALFIRMSNAVRNRPKLVIRS